MQLTLRSFEGRHLATGHRAGIPWNANSALIGTSTSMKILGHNDFGRHTK
jgi:hypothetical protein